MDGKNDTLTLFCSQVKGIAAHIRSGGVHQAKTQFIREKYGEVSHIFMTVYAWYAQNAPALVPKPAGAESGIWAFADLRNIDRDEGSTIMELRVPKDKAVLFRASEWNVILNLSYLGSDDADSQQWTQKIRHFGLKHESDIILQPFYPQLKGDVTRSWRNLFRHDAAIKRGDAEFPDVQAGLWEIRPEWVVRWDV